MTAYDIPEHSCPYCARTINATSGLTHDDGPTPGDWSVCIRCAGLLVFADDLTMREPTEVELERMVADPDLRRTQAAVKLAARLRS